MRFGSVGLIAVFNCLTMFFVYAYGDAKVNIYGGNFVNDQDYNDHNAQLDLIYADQQAVINIYGGTFESKSANNRPRAAYLFYGCIFPSF